MSYNTSRYLNFLTAVEALTTVQKATVDDVNPLAAYTPYTGPDGYLWASGPSAGGAAYEAAWHTLNAGGILNLMAHFLDDAKRALLAAGYPFRTVLLPPIDRARLWLAVENDPGRVRMAFLRAGEAVLLKDFADRAAAATTVYAPIEPLIPFASL